jgi:3-oxosteroid 1-dehydrogenase
MAADDWGAEWDHVADVVVVGCGAAGASAAATAAAAGASVVVLEKAPAEGGTTALSDGVMWLPNNPLLRQGGLVDDRDAALRYMARTAYPVAYDPDDAMLGLPPDRYRVIEAFYDNASAALEHHMDVAGLVVEPVDYPDYYAHLPEDACPTGRVVQPVTPPGWRRGVDAQGGQRLVETLIRYAQTQGADLRTGCEVAQLVRNRADEVVGVVAHVERRTVLIGARRGVLFCSGGFVHDERLTMDYLRGPIFGGAGSPSATGDFVRIGTEVGAQLGNMAHAWWDQVVVELALRSRSTRGDVYYAYGDAMLMVNRYGRRVVNEKAVYNERGQAHFGWDPYRAEYPNLLLFMLFDDEVVHSPHTTMFRWPVPIGTRERDYLITVPTIAQLAPVLAARLAAIASATGGVTLDDAFSVNLTATIERFNTMAAAGVDEDFHRGETPIEQTWAGQGRPGAASASMHPLSPTGPYHCVILGPGALDTKGGPVTDEHARVMALHGQPVPGLYGAGNCIAAPSGQAYWGPGGTIGPALTFGYIAATHASAQPDRAPA